MHASKGTREGRWRGLSLQTGERRMSGIPEKNISADEILIMLCADLRLARRLYRRQDRSRWSIIISTGSLPVTIRHLRRLVRALRRSSAGSVPFGRERVQQTDCRNVDLRSRDRKLCVQSWQIAACKVSSAIALLQRLQD